MNILLEGKKEILEKLKTKYPDEGEFIDKVFSIDVTPKGKYSEWIGRYLDSALKFKAYDQIEDIVRQIIIPFEEKYERIDSKVLDDFRNKLESNGVKINAEIKKILENPKDINTYTKAFYALFMLEVLDETISRKKEERLAKKGGEKIFENSDYLVVKPNTYEASCYYGANTRWCTASKTSRSHFDTYYGGGFLYYFINKKNPTKKMALYIEKEHGNRKKYVYNSNDDEVNIGVLYDEFTELTEVIDGLTNNVGIIASLRQFISGKNTVDSILLSDYVVDFKINTNDRGESLIVLDFNGIDTYKQFFDLDDDDKYLLDIIDSYYSNFDYYIMDKDSEWDEGYMLRQFNNENMVKLKNIVSLTLPQYASTDFEDDRVNNIVCSKLRDLFKRNIENIIDKYASEMERISEIGVKTTINDDLCEYFKTYGIEKSSENCFYKYYTTVNNLIKLFDEHSPNKKTIRDLMMSLGEDSSVGGWIHNMYEMISWDDFDDEQFQNEVEWELESIMDEIKDSSENFEEYSEIVKEITDKYSLNTWHRLPRDNNQSFRVNEIRYDSDSVTISVTISGKGHKNYLLDGLSEFYSLIYNYKLFEDN